MYSIGPGFFIFFQETQIEAGGGYPAVIIYTREEKPVKVEKETFKKIQKKVKQYKKAKEVSRESVYQIVEVMADQWSAKSTMEEYNLTYNEALDRYKDLILELTTLMMDDEEEAILMILANI